MSRYPAVKIKSRILFLDVSPERILVDGVATGTGGRWVNGRRMRPGEPFSVAMDLPGNSWRIPALRSLERWAEEGEELEIGISSPSSGPRATLSDQRTTAVFDLLAHTA